MVDVPRWGGLRPEPYDPDAVDADNDGIVQEGTAWERPVGTRLLDELGREIIKGSSKTTRPKGLRYVDKAGNDVAYTPRDTVGRGIPGTELKPPTSALGKLGTPSLREMGLTLEAQGVRKLEPLGLPSINDMMVPPTPEAVPEVAPAAPAIRPIDPQLVDSAVSRWLNDTGERFRAFFAALREDRRAVPEGLAEFQHQQAATLLDIVANAPTTDVPLFRGERIGLTEDEIADLYRAGATIEVDMRGFSSSEKTATRFSTMGDNGVPVVFELAPGARAAKLDDYSAQRFEVDEAEHLVSGTMRVESVRFEGRGKRRRAIVTMTETDPLEPHPSGSYLSILEQQDPVDAVNMPGPSLLPSTVPSYSTLEPAAIDAARAKGLWSDLPDGDVELPYDPADISLSGMSDDVREEMFETFRSEAASDLERVLDDLANDLAGDEDVADVLERLEATLMEAYGADTMDEVHDALASDIMRRLSEDNREAYKNATDPNAPLFIAVDSTGLRGLILDGRYKSQFETGTSNGAKNLELRREVEADVLDVPDDIPDALRPVYGYAIADTEEKARELVEHYGEFHVVLHPETRQRSTVTFGDSLDSVEPLSFYGDGSNPLIRGTSAVGSPDRKLIQEAFGPEYRKKASAEAISDALRTHLGDEVDEAGMDLEDWMMTVSELDLGEGGGLADPSDYTYVEAQIHGGVSLHDVAEIELNLRYASEVSDLSKSEQQMLRELVPVLEEHGITYTGIDEDLVDQVLERGDYEPLLPADTVAEIRAQARAFADRAHNLDYDDAVERLTSRLNEIDAELAQLAPDDKQVPHLMIEREALAEERDMLDSPPWLGQLVSDRYKPTYRPVDLPNGKTGVSMESTENTRALVALKADQSVRGTAALNVEFELRRIAGNDPERWLSEIDDTIEQKRAEAEKLVDGLTGPDDPKMRDIAILAREVDHLEQKRLKWQTAERFHERRVASGKNVKVPPTMPGRLDRLRALEQGSTRRSVEWPSFDDHVEMAALRRAIADDLAAVDELSKSGKTVRAVAKPMRADGEFTGTFELDGQEIGRFRMAADLGEQSIHIWDVHVDPAHQRDGVGTSFVEQSMERAREAGFTSATMRAMSDEKHHGVAAWAKAGWETDGPLEGAEADVARALEIMGVERADQVTAEKLRAHAGSLEGLNLSVRMRRDLSASPKVEAERVAVPATRLAASEAPRYVSPDDEMGEWLAGSTRSTIRVAQTAWSLDQGLSEIDSEIDYLTDESMPHGTTTEERAVAVERLREARERLTTAPWYKRPALGDDDPKDARFRALVTKDEEFITKQAFDAYREAIDVTDQHRDLGERIAALDEQISESEKKMSEALAAAKSDPENAEAHLRQAAAAFTRAEGLRQFRSGWADELEEAEASGPPTVPDDPVAAIDRLHELYITADRGALGDFRERDRREIAAINERVAGSMFGHEGTTRDGQTWSAVPRLDQIGWNQDSGMVDLDGPILDANGDEIGWFTRSFNPLTGEVFHGSLEMEPMFQDKGIGGRFVIASLLAEKDAGFTSASLTAANGQGYNGLTKWPGFGFKLAGPVHGDDIGEAMVRLNVSDPSEITEEMLVDNPNLAGLSLAADMTLDLTTWNPRR